MFQPELNYSPPKAAKIPSPAKPTVSVSEKRFNEMLSPPEHELNDSFETNESIFMADENEESILATTLLDNTVVEMNNQPEIKAVDTTDCNTTITTNATSEDDNLTSDWLNLLNTLIEKNSQAVANFHKQMEDIRKQIDETNRQTQEFENMKRRVVAKYGLKDSHSESDDTVCNTLDIQNSKVQNIRRSFKSPGVASPIIGEIRSTIKYLKTPRTSRNARPSVYLTPHSMSFSIKTQYEKLLE